MQNLFYVPPHQPRDIHPRTTGVRQVIKRNAPTRLDLGAAHPAVDPSAIDMGLVTYGDIAPEPALGPVITTLPRASFRVRFGGWITRLGQKIAGDLPRPLGQPV